MKSKSIDKSYLIRQLKAFLEKKVKPLIPTVSNTYLADSENAMSGKAVAEALAQNASPFVYENETLYFVTKSE